MVGLLSRRGSAPKPYDTSAVPPEFQTRSEAPQVLLDIGTTTDGLNATLIQNELKTVNMHCDRYTRLHLVVTRDLHRAGKAHRELLDVCRKRNPDVAADALWKHIMDAGEYLRELIQSRRQHRSA